MSNAAPTHCRVTKKPRPHPHRLSESSSAKRSPDSGHPGECGTGGPDDTDKSAERTGSLRESGIRLLGEKFDPLRLGQLQFWWRVWDSNPRPVFVFDHLTGNGF